jgi:hypothetical protein
MIRILNRLIFVSQVPGQRRRDIPFAIEIACDAMRAADLSLVGSHQRAPVALMGGRLFSEVFLIF